MRFLCSQTRRLVDRQGGCGCGGALMRAAMMVGMMPLWSAPAHAGLFPGAEDVRMQVISKQPGEMEWPFAAREGTLACVQTFGMKVVVFLPYMVTKPEDEDFEAAEIRGEALLVTTDPIYLLTQWEQEKLYAPGMKIEENITRLGPYVTLGKRLCDQPKGAIVGSGEL